MFDPDDEKQPMTRGELIVAVLFFLASATAVLRVFYCLLS